MKLNTIIKRNAGLLSNIAGVVMVKGSSLFLSVIAMPLYLAYFQNNVVLGLWFTLLTILGWILTFDIGIGNGLRNMLVESFCRKDVPTSRTYISSAYILSGAAILVIAVLSYLCFPYVHWNRILNVPESLVDAESLLTVIRIIFAGIFLQLFLKLIYSVLYALQKPAIPNLLILVSTSLQVLFIFVYKPADMITSLISLAWVYTLSVTIPLLCTSIYLFATRLKKCRPSFYYYNWRVALKTLKFGGAFFVIQVLGMVLSGVNDVFISYFYEPSYVVDYQIYRKLFFAFASVFTLALIPVWSAVTKAFVERKYNWLIKLNNLLYLSGIIIIVLQLLLIPFLQIIVNIWLKENAITIDFRYAAYFAVLSSVSIWMDIETTYAKGLGMLKTQLYSFVIATIAKIALIYFLSPVCPDWTMIILVTIAVLIPYCIIQSIVTRTKLINLKKQSLI